MAKFLYCCGVGALWCALTGNVLEGLNLVFIQYGAISLGENIAHWFARKRGWLK